jgi:hypothetical protein
MHSRPYISAISKACYVLPIGFPNVIHPNFCIYGLVKSTELFSEHWRFEYTFRSRISNISTKTATVRMVIASPTHATFTLFPNIITFMPSIFLCITIEKFILTSTFSLNEREVFSKKSVEF